MTLLVACDYDDEEEEEEEDKAGRGGAQRGTTFLAVGRNRKLLLVRFRARHSFW